MLLWHIKVMTEIVISYLPGIALLGGIPAGPLITAELAYELFEIVNVKIE